MLLRRDVLAGAERQPFAHAEVDSDSGLVRRQSDRFMSVKQIDGAAGTPSGDPDRPRFLAGPRVPLPQPDCGDSVDADVHAGGVVLNVVAVSGGNSSDSVRSPGADGSVRSGDAHPVFPGLDSCAPSAPLVLGPDLRDVSGSHSGHDVRVVRMPRPFGPSASPCVIDRTGRGPGPAPVVRRDAVPAASSVAGCRGRSWP